MLQYTGVKFNKVSITLGGITANGINAFAEIQNNPYISSPVSDRSALQGGSLNPHINQNVGQDQDVFISGYKLRPTPYHVKVVSNIQDRLLTHFLPEKLIEKYTTKEFLEKAYAQNPAIKDLLDKQNLTIKIEPENVTNITKSHLLPTMFYAKEIMNQSGMYFSPQDYETMAQAALLHDIGKALIPSEILNKKGTLTDKEREIINLHGALGYEILRTSTLNPQVLNMIKYHHTPDNNPARDSLTQILTVADIFSALKEQRSYKKAMSDKAAFSILDKGVESGEHSPLYVEALKRSRSYYQNMPAEKILTPKTEEVVAA